MVELPEHKLYYVDMVRAEAEDKSDEDEEDDFIGSVVSLRPPCDGILLGCISKQEVDLGVAAQDDGERAAEGDGAGKNQEMGSKTGALQVQVLHTGSLVLPNVQCATEQQGNGLHEYYKPDQTANPADDFCAAQALKPVWMHHG